MLRNTVTRILQGRHKDSSHKDSSLKLAFAADISGKHAADRAEPSGFGFAGCCASNKDPSGEIVTTYQTATREDATVSFTGGNKYVAKHNESAAGPMRVTGSYSQGMVISWSSGSSVGQFELP